MEHILTSVAVFVIVWIIFLPSNDYRSFFHSIINYFGKNLDHLLTFFFFTVSLNKPATIPIISEPATASTAQLVCMLDPCLC